MTHRDTKQQPKRSWMNFEVSQELKLRILQAAADQGRTASNWLRYVIQEVLNQKPGGKHAG